MNWDYLTNRDSVFEKFHGMYGGSGLDGMFDRPSIERVDPNTYRVRVPKHMSKQEAQDMVDAAMKSLSSAIDKQMTNAVLYGEKKMNKNQVLTREFSDFNDALQASKDMSSDMRDLLNGLAETEMFDIDGDDHACFAASVASLVASTNTKTAKSWFVVTVEPDKIMIKRSEASGYGSMLSRSLVEVAEIVYKPEITDTLTMNRDESWIFTLFRSDLVNGWSVKG